MNESPAELRFVGGMNVPSASGRLNATWPLAELGIRRDSINLRPRWFGGWFWTGISVALSEIRYAFPLRGRLLTSGIGLSLADGGVAYFWSFEGERILAALAGVGVPVDASPRRASHVWRLLPPLTPNTHIARLSRPMVFLAPLGLVASIAVLIWILASSPFPWFDAGFVVVWTVSLYANARGWWLSRRHR